MRTRNEPYMVSWKTNGSTKVNRVSFSSIGDRDAFVKRTLLRNSRVDRDSILKYTEGL
jgi:hypothetical protein